MREQVEIPLHPKKPIKGPNDTLYTKIILREPTFDEFLVHGDPATVAQAAGGTPFLVDNEEVIRAYIALCIVEPPDPQLLKQCGARVAREVKQKLLDFFQPDVWTAEPPAT
jgi:hypothetical protein